MLAAEGSQGQSAADHDNAIQKAQWQHAWRVAFRKGSLSVDPGARVTSHARLAPPTLTSNSLGVWQNPVQMATFFTV